MNLKTTKHKSMNLAEVIYQKSLDLPEDKAIQVINFIDFIKSRLKPDNEQNLEHDKVAVSCSELIQEEDVGVIEDAPSDLSNNPDYLNGYGE